MRHPSPAQRDLFDVPTYVLPAPAPKRVRDTSAAHYAHLMDTGTLAARRRAVLAAVEALRDGSGQWPTACEIQAWLVQQQLIPNDGNPNHVKPRCSELADGWTATTVTVVDGRKVKTRRHVPCDLLVRGEKRPSAISGIRVLTWQIRERR